MPPRLKSLLVRPTKTAGLSITPFVIMTGNFERRGKIDLPTKSFPGLRILDHLILGEMAGPFVFGVLIFTMVFVAGDLLFQAAKLIIEHSVGLGVVVRLFAYRLPEVVAMTLPMSCLLSTLLGMTSLSSHSELIALKSL